MRELCNILLLVAVSILVGTTSAFAKRAKEETAPTEEKELKSVHKIIKKGDPQLMYSKGLEFYKAEKWKRAATLFDACGGYYVGNEREDSIAFFSARSKFKDRDYVEATTQLDEFRRKFGRSVFIEDSEAMLSMCKYYLAPGPTRDQTVTTEAIISFSEFIERYPKSTRVEAFQNLIKELHARLEEKAYINAYTYFKIQRYKSAVVALRNALKQFPESPFRENILYYIVVSNYRLAHNSIAEKQAERYLNMLDSYYSFINEYPESKRCKELERYAKDAKNYLDKNNIEKQQ